MSEDPIRSQKLCVVLAVFREFWAPTQHSHTFNVLDETEVCGLIFNPDIQSDSVHDITQMKQQP